jgi:GNAT superfamily N-acetyltransferase
MPSHVFLAISSSSLMDRFASLLTDAKAADGITVEALPDASQDTLRAALETRTLDARRPCIVVSDLLVCDMTCEALAWIREVLAKTDPTPIGTIAVLAGPDRVADIDRVVKPSASAQQLRDAIALVEQRLRYLMRPAPRDVVDYEVAPIARAVDLAAAFRLRHRVYRVMGYLEPETESCKSQLDIHWTDLASLQLGAFVRDATDRSELIGTARIVFTPGPSRDRRLDRMRDQQRRWTSDLLEADRSLRRQVDRERSQFATLSLPAAYTVDLSGDLAEAYRNQQLLGELSRVIVREEYRGCGVSRQLCERAISEARLVGAVRLFLECLELHQGFYERYGFESLKRASERVLGVNRRMITMVQDLRRSTGPQACSPTVRALSA